MREEGSTPSRALLLSRKLRTAVACWKSSGPRGLAEAALSKLWPVLSPVAYKSLKMFLRLGYWPNIRNPRTLNEKIVHRQLFAPHPLASRVADKWRVREYVAERGLGDILNEVYFVTDDPDKIPFDDLPDRFVIKANHGCAMNYFVTDKQTLDRQGVIRLSREWLSLKYGKATRNYETHYDSIRPMVLVERFIGEGHGVPVDYKFYCFHQAALLVDVHVGRFANHTANLYDREWRDIGIRSEVPCGEVVPKPRNLQTMLQIAERLSGDFDFCRVDLYAPDAGRFLFGEITINPAAGLTRFIPREWDFRLGELW